MAKNNALAFIAALGMIPVSGFCQVTRLKCDALHPLQGSTYQYKARNNRCEGFYVAAVGAMAIELVSLTEGPLHYELKSGTVLLASVPGNSQALSVRAVAKPARTYYRMDSVLDGSNDLEWPVDDVLLPQQLTDDRIGIFAWKKEKEEEVFFPVRVVTSNSQTVTRKQPLYLSVRPTYDSESVKWRSSTATGAGCDVFGKWNDAATTHVLADQTVTILLNDPAEMSCIEVAARSDTTNDWATLKLRLNWPRK